MKNQENNTLLTEKWIPIRLEKIWKSSNKTVHATVAVKYFMYSTVGVFGYGKDNKHTLILVNITSHCYAANFEKNILQ